MRIIRISKLEKIAKSFDQAMKQYSLTDPFITFLASAYDNEIAWENIASEEDLKAYVKDVLLPSVMSQVDLNSESGRYLTDIDPSFIYQIMPNDEEVMATEGLVDKKNQKKLLLDIFNGRKKVQFDQWTNALQEEPYKSSPAFQYLMLKPVVERYPPNDRRAGYPFRKEALESTYNKVKEAGGKAIETANDPAKNKAVINTFSIPKSYSKTLGKMQQEELEEAKDPNWFPEKDDPNKGWLFLPSKETEPENYEERRQALEDFSKAQGHSWCTYKGGPGGRFLEKSNFWLYLNNGVAEVAVKETPDAGPNGESKINEFRAPLQGNPVDNWEQVTELFESKGWDSGWTREHLGSYPYIKRFYDELEKIKDESNRFDDDPVYRGNVLDKVRRGDVSALDRVSGESKKAPDVIEAMEQGLLIALRDDARAKKIYKDVDKEFLKNPEILELVVKQWLAELKRNPNILATEVVPAHIKKHPDFNKVLVKAIVNILADGANVDVIKNLPPKWDKNKTLKKSVAEVITDGFKTNPKKFEELWNKELDVFKGLKSDEEIHNTIMKYREEGWGEKIKQDPTLYDKPDFPQDLKDLEGNRVIRDALLEGYSSIIETKGDVPIRASQLFPNNETIRKAVKSNLMSSLAHIYTKARKPGAFRETAVVIPESLRGDAELESFQKGQLKILFKKNPLETFGNNADTLFPPSMRGDPDIITAMAEGVGILANRDPKYYERNKNKLAELGILEHKEVIKGTTNGWKRLINDKPEITWTVMGLPEDHFIKTHMMGADGSLFKQMKKNLITYLNLNPSSWLYSIDYKSKLEQLPESIKNDEGFKKAHTRALGKVLASNPWDYFDPNFPADIKEDNVILAGLRDGLLRYFSGVQTEVLISMDFINRFKSFPNVIQANTAIKEAFSRALITFFGQTSSPDVASPNFLEYIRAIKGTIREYPEVATAIGAALGRIIAKDPILYVNLHPSLQRGPSVQNGLQQARNRLAAPYVASYQANNNPDEVRSQIMNDQNIPDFMKQNILSEMGLGEVIANSSQWYKRAKTRRSNI